MGLINNHLLQSFLSKKKKKGVKLLLVVEFIIIWIRNLVFPATASFLVLDTQKNPTTQKNTNPDPATLSLQHCKTEATFSNSVQKKKKKRLFVS